MPLNGNSVASEKYSTLVKFGYVGVFKLTEKLTEIVIVQCSRNLVPCKNGITGCAISTKEQGNNIQGRFAVDIYVSGSDCGVEC